MSVRVIVSMLMSRLGWVETHLKEQRERQTFVERRICQEVVEEGRTCRCCEIVAQTSVERTWKWDLIALIRNLEFAVPRSLRSILATPISTTITPLPQPRHHHRRLPRINNQLPPPQPSPPMPMNRPRFDTPTAEQNAQQHDNNPRLHRRPW